GPDRRGEGRTPPRRARAVGPRVVAPVRDLPGRPTRFRDARPSDRADERVRGHAAADAGTIPGGGGMRTVEVTEELQAYLDRLVPPRDAVLARMEEEAEREDLPIVDTHEGMLLYMLVKIAGAKRILELGTAIGYSGIWLLRGTSGGILSTYEVDQEPALRAAANFA